MPWKDKTVEELRKEFIEAASEEKANVSALCREFGISRVTGYKWLNRFEEGENLSDRSHRPERIPNKTSESVERAILTLRAEHPKWGAKKILKVLADHGLSDLPCVKTCSNILKRNGMIQPEESAKHQAFQRFEKERCNELWQTDFKGEFLLGNGRKCFPLDIIDDCSRACLGIIAKPNTIGIRDDFEQIFREYGLPNSILSDNGVQFAGFKLGLTQFERWLMDLDITPIHGKLKHPQTQGKIERFHRSMKAELLNGRTFPDLETAAAALEEWRIRYNEERPHEALGQRYPAEVYTKSQRGYPDVIRPYEYSGDYSLIKVNNWGYLRFDRISVYIGQTMENTRLEVRPNGDNSFAVCYRNFQIGEFDADEQRPKNRKIVRLS